MNETAFSIPVSELLWLLKKDNEKIKKNWCHYTARGSNSSWELVFALGQFPVPLRKYSTHSTLLPKPAITRLPPSLTDSLNSHFSVKAEFSFGNPRLLLKIYEEWPSLAATRESPRTETKTQHSQKIYIYNNRYRDVLCNLIKIMNTAVCYIWKLLREEIQRVLITRKAIFSISLMLYLYEKMDVH